jgi:methylenetetrahydrofolate dehydrogenase (NADP+)/methenyltetrahydrofolate cyclohydrolase
MSIILSGIPLRDKIKEDLKTIVSFVPQDALPQLAIIQVGEMEASTSYIKGKIKFGEEIGVPVILKQLPATATEEQIIDLVLVLNADPRVAGIIVQLPLPEGISKDKIVRAIDPEKDADGLHPLSGVIPATTRGIISLLDFNGISLAGKRVLMIGRSELVGKPTAMALLDRDATITIAHHLSQDLRALCKEADIIVSATGVPSLITKDHVKAGQVIVDVGINKVEGKIVGDVAYDEVLPIVSALTPVPGGIGPLTVASLFQNLLREYTDDSNN